MSCGDFAWGLPSRTSRTSFPSMVRSVGTFAPVSFANEGNRSVVVAIASVLTPAGIVPGHHVRVGSRMCPSYFGPPLPRLLPRPHVIGIRNPEVFIESLCQWKKHPLVAQMPLAETPGRVSTLPQDFRDRDFLRIQSSFLARKHHAPIHPDTMRVRARHQSRTRRSAGCIGNIELSQHRFLLLPCGLNSECSSPCCQMDRCRRSPYRQ